MKNYLDKLDEILYKGLRPWLNENGPDEKFASMISGVKAVEINFPLKYQIEFERRFNNKTNYYSKILLSEKHKAINGLLENLMEDDHPQLLKYRLNDVLNKKLKTRIKDIGRFIKEEQFELDYIDPHKTTFDLDQEHKTNTYVFQLLKLTLIHIYLEIQEAYLKWISDEFIVEDFYTQLLFEPIPNKAYIKVMQKIVLDVPEIVGESQEIEPPSLKSFTYINYNTQPESLTDLCDSLKKYGFIKKDTSLAHFKKVFSGKEISAPIVWTGNPTEFSYFIKLLHNTHKLVVDLKQEQWKVALQCFIQKDGSNYTNSIRKLGRPARTGDKLDKAISLLF